jgi:Asp-tRNA(Asn)/Glu-tRNA(Gln) amidotransferase A subunit family amidase
VSGPLDASATAELVRSGTLSPAEAVEAVLETIAAAEPAVNAFTVLRADEALTEAKALEAKEPHGPLHGVPVSVKDVVWTRGMRTTDGTEAYADFVPDEDAVAVERLRAAGAIVVGKTNNPELCLDGITDNAIFGLTRNPWSLDRTPGGSSGGAAASVAYGGPLALGSDGGGSIRIPASFCGVAGLKPTFGLVPNRPGFRGWPTLSVCGPIARSVRDLALALDVLAGPDPRDPASFAGRVLPAVEPGALRIAASEDLGFAAVDPAVRTAFRAAVDRLAGEGHAVEEAHPATGDPAELWTTIALAEGHASHRRLLGRLGERAQAFVEAGSRASAAAYLDALDERGRFAREWLSFFEGYDVLLTPAMQLTAFPVGQVMPTEIDGRPVDPEREDWCAFCYALNLTGQPGISVPCGFDQDGLPIGLQVVGPRLGEATILGLAAAWEKLEPWADRVLPVPAEVAP